MGFIPDNAFLVTADITTLCPSIPHNVGLKALREVLDKREQKKIPMEILIQIAEFLLNILTIKLSSRSQEQQ